MGNQQQKQSKPIIVISPQDEDDSIEEEQGKTDLQMLEDEIKEMASSMEDMKRELTCTIWYINKYVMHFSHELYDDPRELPCGHSFCYRCAVKVTMIKKRCPLCKVYYHSKDVAQNFHLDNIVDAYTRYEKAFKKLKNHRDKPLKLPEIQEAQRISSPPQQSQQRINQTPPEITPNNNNNFVVLKTPKRSNSQLNVIINNNINNNNTHPPTSPVNSKGNKRTKAMRFVQQENDVAHIAQELDTEFLIDQAESLLNPNSTLHPKTPKMNQSVHRYSRRNLSVPQL